MANSAVDGGIIFGLAVTIDTPAHVEFVLRGDDFHRLDLAVALSTVDTGNDVRLVAELDVVGKVVDLLPSNRFALAPGGSNLLEVFLPLGGSALNFVVTVHACIDARHDRRGPLSIADVAIATGYLVLARVQLVAELDRLRRSVAFSRVHTG
jgi:hypothetical protein